MKFLSIIAFLSLSAAAVVASPENGRRPAPCDDAAQIVINPINRAFVAIDTLTANARLPPVVLTYVKGTRKDLTAMRSMIQSGIGHRTHKQSAYRKLQQTETSFASKSQNSINAVSSMGPPVSQLADELRGARDAIISSTDALLYCWGRTGLTK
ncbi:hypothetical protein BGZ83_005313 [Gryganskiella cystojenkinii]|nr:hypothetical protein BGZ83_005313 [Gryganskiella cystojenkinii]